MKQKFLTLILLLTVCIGTLCASNTSVDGIWYNFNSSTETATVTYRGTYYDTYNDEYSGSVVIPSSVAYNGTTYSVTSIGGSAFFGCSSLTSITIPNSVTSIGENAFRQCSSLTSVTIPNSVTSIGSYAFSSCSSLTSVTIPNSVTSIGGSAFYSCSSLTSVTIPNSVTSIESAAFSGCSSLTSVTIPNSVTSIGGSAFYGCSSLVSITIPNSVTSIGNYAFHSCSSLTSVTIPNSVTSIGESAFRQCSSLTSLIIGEGVTTVAKEAFLGCSSLTTVVWNAKKATSISITNDKVFIDATSTITSFVFGENVEYIPDYLCGGLSKITFITIPKSVTKVGVYAFNGCTALKSIHWNAKRGTDYSTESRYRSPFYSKSTQYQSFTFGEDVEHIPNCLCAGLSNISSVTIPNGVTSIGDRAFENCSGLTSVTIGESVTSIGSSAFSGCSSLTLLTIPNSVTSIGSSAFYSCTSLISVTIPNSVTSIGSYAFDDCKNLVSFTSLAINPPSIGTIWGNDIRPVCYVPCGSLPAYATSSWKTQCSQFIEQSPYTITLIPSDSTHGVAKVTSRPDCNSAILTAIPNEGCSFVKWSDGNTQATRYVEVTEDISLTAYFAKEGYTIHVYQDCNTTIE